MFEKWLEFHGRHEKIKQELENLLAKEGMTLNIFTTLYILGKEEKTELRISDLGRKIGLSDSATSRMVVKMENETDFVIKKECVIDNRALYVILTESGSNKLKEMQSKIEKILEDNKL